MRRALVVLVVSLAVPATAQAATVHQGLSHAERFYRYSIYSSDHAAAYFDAAPGERNRLRTTLELVNGSAEKVTFHDPGAVISAGKGCTSIDAHTASCTEGNRILSHAEINLGDRDDTLDAGRYWTTAFGGPGNDVLRGGELGDELYAGSGRDRLLGGGGNDVLVDGDRSGASGAAGPGRDVLDGGADHDLVDYERHERSVTVDLRKGSPAGERGERDAVRDVEDVTGGEGRDRLVSDGDDRGAVLRGHGGGDVLVTGGGPDVLYGGLGGDRLSSGGRTDILRGGPGPDSFSCGHGADTVYDPVPGELLGRHCNSVHFQDTFGGPGRSTPRSLDLPAQPLSVSRRAAVFGMSCPLTQELEELLFSPCDVKVLLRTRAGRLLGRARYRQRSRNDPERVRIRLKRLGRRLVRRRRGVVASLSVRGLLTHDGRPARVGWSVRIRRG